MCSRRFTSSKKRWHFSERELSTVGFVAARTEVIWSESRRSGAVNVGRSSSNGQQIRSLNILQIAVIAKFFFVRRSSLEPSDTYEDRKIPISMFYFVSALGLLLFEV